MTINFRRLLGVAFLLTVAASPGLAQTARLTSVLDMTEVVYDWKISRQFTLDVADAMPAESYTFRPNPDEMTFGEQIVNIAVAKAFRFNEISGVQPPFPLDLSKTSPTDKKSAIAMLEQSFD